MEVAERIRAQGADLTAAERRVAEVVLASPQAIGFGTVADLAELASVGAASVVRLATKLGFEGYSELQQAVQHELTRQLRPAAERIHETDLGSRAEHASTEMANVRAAIADIDDAALDTLVRRMADLERPVAVLSSVASAGVAQQFVSQLQQLRGDVAVIGGSDVVVQRDLAVLDPNATAIVIDVRRYERWVLDAHRSIAARSIWSAGVTDGMLSPVAAMADVAFVVPATSSGPFDSYVGVLALLDLVTIDVAALLKDTATGRLAAVEAAWNEHETLTAGHPR